MAARVPRLPNPGENKKHLIPSPQCSCPTCDSLVCFTKRQHEEPCSCHKCPNSKTCLCFPYKAGTDADLVNTVKSSMEGDDVAAEERIKREITYEFGEILKARNVKKYKSKVSGEDCSVADKDNIKEQISEQVHNVTVNISHKAHNSSTPRLSAQIKTGPYKSAHGNNDKASEPSSYEMSVYDLLKKITDVYKACSCKVCECIVGKSSVPKNKFCKCEPCDCKDCTILLPKIYNLEGVRTNPPIGCPCVRCTRSQCKGITNRFDEPQICDCPPCSCIKCNESYVKSCKCEPCQCLECKAMSIKGPRTFIVASIGEQRNYCECSPCECIACGGYGTTSCHMREAATNVNSHQRCQCATCVNENCITDGSQACKCDRRSRMIAKPNERGVREYEILTLLTGSKDARSKPLKNNTIAMYDRVPSLYNNMNYQKRCSCDVCECVTGNCKQYAVHSLDSIKSSQWIDSKDTYQVKFASNMAANSCKCSSCECQISSTKIGCRNKAKTVVKNCRCEVCYCFNCEGEIKEYKRNLTYVNNFNGHSTKESRKCKPWICVKCSNSVTCNGDICYCAKYNGEQYLHDSSESIYPIKRTEILSPFTKPILKSTINNKHRMWCVEDHIKSDFSTKLNDSLEKKNSKRDTVLTVVSDSEYPQNYGTVNKIKYILRPAKGTEMPELPKPGNLKYVNKNDITSHKAQKNYGNFQISESANFVVANSRNPKERTKVGVQTESILRAYGSKTNGGSLDYLTKFFESPRAEKVRSQDCIQVQSAHHADSYTDEEKANDTHRLNNTSYIPVFNGNLGCEFNSFESDKEIYFSRDIAEENFIYYPRIQKATPHKQLYNHQYWIKNFDVSLTAPGQNLQGNTQYFINHDSGNNINTILGSDENISHSHNIGDHSIGACSFRVDDLFYNDDYYEGVQRTLHRARAFSLQLMKTLEKYERANKEFQSLTQKLKLSHASLVSKNILEISKTVDANVSLTIISSVNQKNDHKRNDILLKNNQPIEKKNPLQLYQSNDVQNEGIIKDERRERCEDFVNSSVFKFSTDNVLGVESPENFKTLCQTNNRGKLNERKMNEFTILYDRKKRGVKKPKVKTIKHVVLISKKALSTGALNSVMKSVRSTQTLSHNYVEVATDANPLSRIYISTEEEKTPTKKSLEKLLPISKKNFCLITEPVTKNKGICIFPTIQNEVKQAVRSVSMQTKTRNKENVPRTEMALQNLQVEVQKLLKMPLLEQVHNLNDYRGHHLIRSPQTTIDHYPCFVKAISCQINHETNCGNDIKDKVMNCKSSKSCCDAHKASFLSLRRVSDHTVLVKWAPPQLTRDITGYELLVDGRAVQKVLSPSRCAAVVTCLPHCDTILLTIRTITSHSTSGHFPSSTIVYHPRVK